MDEQEREALVELGTRALLQVIEEHNIDPDSIYVVSMTESFEDNDIVEVAQRFQVIKIVNIQEGK
ncbi:hypothetical protein Z3_87 [Bacillus phage Z3]|nr:hypothetical protein Z3_87 [Bacillus phage Z3]